MIRGWDLIPISWRCVHFSAELDMSAAPAILQDNDVRLFELSALGIESKEGFLDAIALTMEFPDYFGRNWDALNDCLGDMSWAPASGYVLVVRDAAEFWRRQFQVAGTFVEVWLSAAEFWAEHKKPFHLVFIW